MNKSFIGNIVTADNSELIISWEQCHNRIKEGKCEKRIPKGLFKTDGVIIWRISTPICHGKRSFGEILEGKAQYFS